MKYLLSILFVLLAGCATGPSDRSDFVVKGMPNCEGNGGLKAIIWAVDLRSFLVYCMDGTVFRGNF